MAEAGEQQPQGEQAQDWKAPLMADPELAPHLEKITEKDLPTFVKSSLNKDRLIRDPNRVVLPGKDAKPEEVKSVKEKLAAAGLITLPPDTYEVKLPEGVPAEAWSEEDTKIAAGFAKKYGLSQDALNDGIAVVAGILGKHGEAVQVDRAASEAKIKEWAEKEGHTVEQINAALDRFNKDPRGWDAKTAEAVSKSGWADNPLVIQAIFKLMKDSGTFDTRNDAGAAGSKDADAEIAKYQPGGEKWGLISKGDKTTLDERDAVYAKKFPGTVQLT